MMIEAASLVPVEINQPPAPKGWMTFGHPGRGGCIYPVAVLPNRFQRWALRVVLGIHVTKEPPR